MVYPTSHRRINSLRSSIGYLIGGVGAVLISEGITMVFQYTGLKRLVVSMTSSVCWVGSAGHFNTSSTVKDITASTKIRKVGPKASKSFILICFSICVYRWETLEWILQSENRSKICYPKSSFVRCWPRRPKSAFVRCLDGSGFVGQNRVIFGV